jgi:hypothetical protein
MHMAVVLKVGVLIERGVPIEAGVAIEGFANKKKLNAWVLFSGEDCKFINPEKHTLLEIQRKSCVRNLS